MLDSYASRTLHDHLRASAGGASRRAEREGVVLFLDIAGSTAMSEQFAGDGAKGAERLAGILNLYFGDVFGIVAAHGGDAVRIDGDAVLALWPAQAAARAAEAALVLRDAFVAWRPWLGVRMRHRVCLGGGRVAAASFQGEGHRSFFVLMGDAVRAATALSQAAEPGEVLVTADFAAQLAGRAEVQPLEDGSVRLLALSPSASEAPPPLPKAVFGDLPVADFLPRIVVDRARAGHAEWLAEFRQVTMVYTQLAGLHADRASTFERLDQAIRQVADAVRPLGLAPTELAVGDKGVVLVVACGLPPSARENNAARAVEAATRIRTALAPLGIAASIGVATGRAFCGDVGNAARREYLVTGPVMYYAARLMQAAAGGILLDGATAQAAGDYFAFPPAEPLVVKGRTEPLAVHRLDEGRQAAARLLPATRLLHGREEEERTLLALLDGRDRGRIAAIEAEAGAGKSLLLAHFEASARARGYRTLAAATSPVDMMSPYFAWRGLVAQLLDGAESDLPALRRRLLEVLRGSAVQAKAALVEDILPLDLPDKGLAAEISGAARVAGIEDVVVELAQRAGARQPLALLVDDVHWLDDPSARLLLAVARRVPRVRIVLATRPLGADSGPHVRQLLPAASARLQLARLPAEALARIVGDALGVRTIPPRLAEFVQARSEGLPFHAEQLALSLRDQGVIEIADGRCRVTVSDLPAARPNSRIEDVIVSRIDSLEPAQQLALKVASAIGRGFDEETLRAVYPVEGDKDRLPQILAALVEAGLLEGAGPGAYAFRHVLIRDVTHELVVHEKREELHRQIADWLESRHAADLQEHFAALAEHLEEGARPERAIQYRGAAAAAALRRYANHDALVHLDRIARVASAFQLKLPPAQDARFAAIRADACHALSRFDEASRHFHACAQASGIALPADRRRAAVGIARELGAQALHRFAFIPKPADPQARERGQLAAHIHARLAEQAYFAGDAVGILHGTLASLNRAEQVGAAHEIIEGYGALAIGLGTARLHGLARFYRDRSLARARSGGALEGQGMAHVFAAVYSFQAGDWDKALEHCRQGAQVCHEIGDRFRQQTCAVVEAYTEIMLGHYARAAALLDAFGPDAPEVENVPVRAWIFAGRAQLDLLQGRPAAALANVQAARDPSLHRAEVLLCDGLEAVAQWRHGDAQAALRAAQRALASMRASAPTMGILVASIEGCAEVFLAHAQAHPDDADALRDAQAVVQAARRYAGTTRVFVPRARLLVARLALLRAHRRGALRATRRGLADAQRLGLPLEEAQAHLALALLDPPTGADHHQRAQDLLQGLGLHPT